MPPILLGNGIERERHASWGKLRGRQHGGPSEQDQIGLVLRRVPMHDPRCFNEMRGLVLAGLRLGRNEIGGRQQVPW